MEKIGEEEASTVTPHTTASRSPALLGRLVTLDVKLPSLQHMVGFQARDHQHQLLHGALKEPL